LCGKEFAIRILVLNYEFPPVGGGGGRVSEDLCRVFAARGHCVRVLTSHVMQLPRKEWRDGYEVLRIPVGRNSCDRCTPVEMASFVGLASGRVLYDAVRWKPDIIHVHFAVPTGPLAWLARRLTGVPYVLTAHLGDVPGGCPEQTDRLFRVVKPFTVPVWRSAAHITAVSEFTRRLAETAYGLPVETVLNGVNLDTCRPNLSLSGPTRRLIFAGRFTTQKNVLFLIDLLSRVRDLNCTLDMFGDGPLNSAVRARVNEYGLSERVRLHGWVPPEQVEQAMSASDVLVLPSLSEGLSVVGIRALAFGLAILASNVGGNLGLVRAQDNGFLCPVNDFAAFESRLRWMFAEDERLLRMKKASRELAQDFDLPRIVRRYEEIFTSVVAARRKTAA
jgi:glycosyltransferase involved in cell wall biosynthesis